jgi:ribosomal-protein-alanine N-acetyltransferase
MTTVTTDDTLTPVRLRPIRHTDWTRIHEWAQHEVACRYQPWGPNTPEQTESFASEAVAAWSVSPQPRYVWVAVRPADDVVGLGELHPDMSPGVGELSYAVHLDYWGQGIGTASARLLRDYGFQAFGLHRVEAT